jgi:hypothetical protein
MDRLLAETVNESSCASLMMRSHAAVFVFFGETRARISSSRISPPPPGSPASPARLRRASTSFVGRFSSAAKFSISEGEKASSSIVGKSAERRKSRSSYHSIRRSG